MCSQYSQISTHKLLVIIKNCKIKKDIKKISKEKPKNKSDPLERLEEEIQY